jgi:hypothetical protein
MIDEDAPHGFSGGGKEMGPVLPGLFAWSHQAKPGLMNQGGGLQCVVGVFARHAPTGEGAQFVIDSVGEASSRFRIGAEVQLV